MNAIDKIRNEIKEVVSVLFQYELNDDHVILTQTKKEFEGDYTFVVFPLVKALSKSPQDIAETIGNYLVAQSENVTDFNVIKGFLNLNLENGIWNDLLKNALAADNGAGIGNGKKVLVEFASPNTNKPLHLGHIRNILLGWSMSQIAEANGFEVIKTQIVNDRGIAICKSMLAWKKLGEGTTPQTKGIKGDHFVGHFYVEFEKFFQNEYKDWQKSAEAKDVYTSESQAEEIEADFFKRYKNTYFNTFSDIGKETKTMLIDWENGDETTIALWKKMNGWVYEGFEETYTALGVSFDDIYYESDTYLLGKKAIEKGLDSNAFYAKEDGSVWVNLEPNGMDHKILLRSDGTSVYMTQDIGTAIKRNEDHHVDSMVYTVADEQDYHFKALFAILKNLGEPYADQLHHLSYGMVDLPSGKMKSREGTVVDADDLIAEVIEEARKSAEERGGLEGLSEIERNEVYKRIGIAALKYFIIKVNPRKRMTFDPKESVDMQGTTGPYIQNAYVRIKSILRKAGDDFKLDAFEQYDGQINEMEKDLLQQLHAYNELIVEAYLKYDPALIANYCYSLAKSYHRYYHEHTILKAESEALKKFRLNLSYAVANRLKKSMLLIGIEMPEHM